MDFIQKNDAILLVRDNSFDLESSSFSTGNIKTTYNAAINFEHADRLTLGMLLTYYCNFHLSYMREFSQWRISHIENCPFFFNSVASYEKASFTLIVLRVSDQKDIEFYAKLLKLLKPKGRLVHPNQNTDSVLENLKLAGFINASANGNGENGRSKNLNTRRMIKY